MSKGRETTVRGAVLVQFWCCGEGRLDEAMLTVIASDATEVSIVEPHPFRARKRRNDSAPQRGGLKRRASCC